MATRAAFLGDQRGPSFEEEWPELARRLERFLATKGVETWLRGDVVQEAGVRLYRKWSRLDRSRPLWNLLVTIALGILIDEHRKTSRVDLVPDVPESEVNDVEARALGRVYLTRTRATLNQMSSDERRVLLAEIGGASPLLGSSDRIKVLRLRARVRLREKLGPWAPSAIALRVRYLRERVAQKRSLLETHLPAMSTALVNVGLTITLGVAGVAGTSYGAANSEPSRGTQSLSLQGPEVLANRRLADLSDIPRPGGRTRSSYDRSSGPADNTKDTAAGLGGWAARRQKEVSNLAGDVRDLGEDGRNLGEDVVNLGKDVVNLGEDVRRAGEAWANGRRKELGKRAEEVVCLLAHGDC